MLDYFFGKLFLALVRFYRLFLSPVFRQFGGRCRFYPTCSTYAVEAIKVHGGAKGGWLTLKRFVKCGPFHEGGYDPVPQKCNEKKENLK